MRSFAFSCSSVLGKSRKLLSLCVLALFGTSAAAQQLAFPGAEGWGRFAKGGRYGGVYHVTNLNDTGTGSLRDAVSQPNRIVVFDVAGVIRISSRISFAANLYVAGQTAPGEGITVYGDGVSFSGADNLICRYLRVRMGHGGSDGKDCAGVAHGTNMIFDHCSFAWGLDETFSINSDGKGALGDITIQNCIIGQGLMTHSAGGLIQADNITLFRNFYCDNSTRNNKVKGKNQYANNIVYNWNNGAYIMGGDSEGQSYCNIQGNLFINGPSGGGAAFTGGNGNFHFYANDNWQDSNKDGNFAPQAVNDYSASDRQSSPYAYPTLPVSSARNLITDLLPTVGASLPYRDMTDCYMVDEVLSFGKRGELIANEGSLPYGIPSTWNVYKGMQRQDSDKDGMPDAWEEANGTNPKVNDAMQIASNGYANIENYINGITSEQRDFYLRKPMLPSLLASTTNSVRLGWADYTDGEEGFSVECKQADGSWKEVGRTQANENQWTMNALTPGTAYSLRVRAFAGAEYSEYSDALTVKTRPNEVSIVDIDSYEPDYIWTPLVTEWSVGSEGWKAEQNWQNVPEHTVLFETEEGQDAVVSLSGEVVPSSVVVKGDGQLTFDGDGSLSGVTTSLNKAGKGTLVVKTTNDYQGETVIHDGTLSFSVLKDGGIPSGIGASQEFAQNWIWDGGTYRYTGGSTSTNRSARLLSPTTFFIASKSAVVQENGSFEGKGDFILDGAGKLQIASPDFFKYTGRTILRGGEMFLSTANASKGGVGASSRVVLAGGTLSTKGENEAYETYSFPITVEEGTTSVYAPHRNCYMAHTVSGAGTLQLNIPYVREYIKGNWTNFNGRIIANALSNGNLFLAESSFNMPNAVVVLKNGARACNWDTNGDATLGGLSGVAGTQLCGSSKQQNGFKCIWHIGTANTNEVFAGTINNYSCSGSGHVGTVSIEKKGSGYWRLTGTNDYSGTTLVSAGKLIVNGTHTGKGAYTVESGATLCGQGTIAADVTIRRGGILMAGDSLVGTKKLTLQGTTTLQTGARMCILIKTTSSSIPSNYFDAPTKIALGTGATLEIDMSRVDADLPSDKSIRVFTTTSVITGKFSKILPEYPSETQEWDTSELYTKGLLYVRDRVDETSVKPVVGNADENVSKVVYGITGVRSQGVQQHGVSILQMQDGSVRKVMK